MTTQPPRVSRIEKLRDVCLGNEMALQFCCVFLEWCHWIDDVIDRDVAWTPEEVVRVNLEALVTFSSNPFFQQHKASLMPLVIQAFRAWADSCAWEKREGRRDRRAADIMKSLYHEVFWHVGYIVATQAGRNGWQHMAEMTRRHRAFDYDYKG